MSAVFNMVGSSGGPVDHTIEDAIITRTITEYHNDELTSLKSGAFCRCSSLTSVDLPSVTQANSDVFAYCTSLASVNLPSITRFGAWMFEGCTALTSISLPALTTLGSSAFSNCEFLSSVNLPLVTSISGGPFRNCASLTSLDLPSVTRVGSQAFDTASALKALILRNETMCVMSDHYRVFINTPIAGGTGYIYVPSALIDSYKSATNWSSFSMCFRPLENYTVDGTITGALDTSKI